jgi:hypothetical protein
MIKANNVYLLSGSEILPPSTSKGSKFNLNSFNTQLKIKSIYIDWTISKFIAPAQSEPLPLEKNNVVYIKWTIGNSGVVSPDEQIISRRFEDITFTAGAFDSGHRLNIFKPVSYKFDNFFFQGQLKNDAYFSNNDPVNTYYVYYTIAIEAENLNSSL